MERVRKEKARNHGKSLVTSLMKLKMDVTKVNSVPDTTGS